MGTRGAVGIGTVNDWVGVYNHSDSYPTGLGKEVWAYVRSRGILQPALHAFASELVTYNDWREFRSGGLCEYCGKVGVGQPHSINGGIYLAASKAPGSFPDPAARQHQHSNEPAPIRSENAPQDALFIEWVYVINPATMRLLMLKGVPAHGMHQEVNGQGEMYSVSNYQYALLREVALAGEEPDWQQWERDGEALFELFAQRNDTRRSGDADVSR